MNTIDLDPWIREALRCPVTGAKLIEAVGPHGEPELHSTAAQGALAFPVRDGIPVLLEHEARVI